MAYVDLNPFRIGLCKTTEASDHSRIKKGMAQVFDLKQASNEDLTPKNKILMRPLQTFSGSVI
jgi:hypothetical protein